MLNIPLVNQQILTGLEIEDGYIKAVQAVKTQGSRKVTKLFVKKTAASSPEELLAALKDTARELNGRFGRLCLCIPRHKVTVRLLRVPSSNPKEIAGMARLQSVKELPFPKDELISDYIVSGQNQQGYSSVILSIIHQNSIKEYMELLQRAGLKADRITFSTDALLSWYKTAFRTEDFTSNSILLDIDRRSTEIVLFYNSQLSFSRGLTFGTEQFKNSPNMKVKLAEEIRRTISGYSGQENTGGKIERILLEKGIAESLDLKDYLSEEFRIPCRLFQGLKNIRCRGDIAKRGYPAGFSFLKILGAVLDAEKRQANLLPANLQQEARNIFRKQRVYSALWLFLAAAALLSIITAKEFNDKQQEINYLNREIEKSAPLAEEIEGMLKKIDLIMQRQKMRGSCIDVLRELHILVPAEISLSAFTYDEEKKTAELEGLSSTMAHVFSLISILEQSPYFKNVQLKYSSGKDKVQRGAMTKFKIECNLE